MGRRPFATMLVVLAVMLSAGRAFGGALPPGGTFTDDDGTTHEGSIEAIAAEGITKGCNPPTNDLYCPKGTVTRAQMAAFLVRALGLTDNGGGDLFIDDDGSIFEGDIDKLGTAGVTRGCNPPVNDRFCPDGKVTRGQMAAFLVRAFGHTDDGGGNLFVDDDGSVFETDIDRMATAGVTKGCNPPENTMYCPGDFVTRGQMATFLGRALGLTAIVPPLRLPDMTGFIYIDYEGIRSEALGDVTPPAIAYADFNADGYLDVFLAGGSGTEKETPMEMYLGDGSGGFSLSYDLFAGPVPSAVGPGKAVIDDFNLDGMPDVLVTDSGVDLVHESEFQILLLSNPQGLLETRRFEELFGDTHDAASGDIDEDGDPDIFLDGHFELVDVWRPILVNDGTGTFRVAQDWVPESVQSLPYFTVEFLDVDGDGHLDLVVAGHEYAGAASSIFWGDGTGKFTDLSVTVIPTVSAHGVVDDIDLADLDGDGLKDLVLLRTGSPPNLFEGYFLQILMQTAPRQFSDETSSRIPQGSSSTDYFARTRLIDTDYDGSTDILVDNKAKNLRWLNDGTGRFEKTTTS